MVLYLHLANQPLADVFKRCARAVASGGHLLILRHDRDNIARGTGGPQDPDVLYDVAMLRAAAAGRAEQVVRSVGDQTAIDTLLLAHR